MPEPELAISEDRIWFGLMIVGMEEDEDGFVVDEETGERVQNINGEDAHVDNIGYIGSGPDGEPELVPDNFSEIVQYHSDRDLPR